MKRRTLALVEQKKAELSQWIAKCDEGQKKLQKINEAIVSNSRKLQEWVNLITGLGE
jgi:hypothetical protein